MLQKLVRSIPAVMFAASLSACGPGPSPTDPNAPPPPAPSAVPATTPPPPSASPAPAQAAPSSDQALREAERRGYEERAREDRRQARAAEPAPQPAACRDCGTISNVSEERVTGDPSLIGTLGGAGAGALAGSQFGKKSGKIAMTVLGAVGGAFAGREVESQVRAKTVYHVTVNMASGPDRTVTVDSLNGMGVGSKVRVVGNSLEYAG